jgi:SAM-dependent methyltransferase
VTNSPARLPHAALNPAERLPKAEKIKTLMALAPVPGRHLRLLEIGTGSGAIAHYFATDSGLHCEVDAVDVTDQRTIADGYRFQRVEGVKLPFADGVFDAVISNHVLEHVGESAEQIDHLREIARVMRDDGIGYLASPNRWQLIEPHYHVAFLSWWPRRWRTAYLRLFRTGAVYDCEPLSKKPLESMLESAGLESRNMFVPALRHLAEVEKPDVPLVRLMASLPDGTLQCLRSISPTHIYLLKRSKAAARR